MDNLTQKEELISQYIEQGNKEAALKALFELIISYAKKKDFSKAQALRDKLFEVDPMALNEIIKSAEFIEEEKGKSMDQQHLGIWSKLYDILTREEANALYYAMQAVSYEKEQSLFRQGQRDGRLFLVNEGELKLTYAMDKEEILIKTLRAGDMAGEETFFTYSFCTTSLKTSSPVRMCSLRQDILIEWENDFPRLETKLQDYCLKREKISDLLKKKGLDRRACERANSTGKVAVQFLDSSGHKTGNPFRGAISNLSLGGLCFTIKISRKETARLLLGRSLNMRLPLSQAASEPQSDQDGQVVAVHPEPFDNYSVHVKFDRPMHEDALNELET